MLRFYYSPGSSAVAAHILLEEVGAEYEACCVSIADGAHKQAEYLARNPKGRIPFLETSEGGLSENPAILEYVAALYPEAGCVPDGVFVQAQARSLCAYLCATAHVAFAHHHRGSRWAQQETSLRDMQAQVAGNLRECAAYLEDTLDFAPWALGAGYTFCDPYVFQFTRWLEKVGVDVAAYPRLAVHRREMLARPAVRRVLAVHGIA